MLKNLIYVAFGVVLFMSCANATKTDKIETIQMAQSVDIAGNLKKMSLDIEGMTCEIGCARTIQSKLSKTQGVKNAVVNFDKKEGIIEYDATEIDVSEIVAVVQEIAGGDLYKVTGTKTVKSTPEH